MFVYKQRAGHINEIESEKVARWLVFLDHYFLVDSVLTQQYEYVDPPTGIMYRPTFYCRLGMFPMLIEILDQEHLDDLKQQQRLEQTKRFAPIVENPLFVAVGVFSELVIDTHRMIPVTHDLTLEQVYKAPGLHQIPIFIRHQKAMEIARKWDFENPAKNKRFEQAAPSIVSFFK
jgi:hypothetical protein